MNKENFVDYLAFLVQAQGSRKAAAGAWGISVPYLVDVLKGRREPGPKLLEALGIRKEVTYVEACPGAAALQAGICGTDPVMGTYTLATARQEALVKTLERALGDGGL